MRLALLLGLALVALLLPASAHADDKVSRSQDVVAGGTGTVGLNAPDGQGIDVALVDSGVVPVGSLAQPGRVVYGPDFSKERNDRDLRNLDTFGHGTHLAGLIAGRDPSTGFAGVAPGARLVSVKIAGADGETNLRRVLEALDWIRRNHDAPGYNIRVVNLSLSSKTAESYKTDPLDAAVESAYFHGIVVVAAAGNRGSDPDAVSYAPGNDPFAITVGAVDDQGTKAASDDTYADWSSTGRTQDGFAKPDISAPGSRIVSTLAPGSVYSTLCPTCVVSGRYLRAGGTSMAAPMVAGAAALILERHPDWTPDEVKSTLLGIARKLPNAGVREVNAAPGVWMTSPLSGANAGIAPNRLVSPSTGAIDYSLSSWSLSSWSSAPDPLKAGWALSSWSCTCGGSGDGVDPSLSSWSLSSWSTRWDL